MIYIRSNFIYLRKMGEGRSEGARNMGKLWYVR